MSLPDGVTLYKPRNKILWHGARAKCVTASVAGALLGVHSRTSLYRLWAEKTDRVQPDYDETEAMRKGRMLEPAAIELAREDNPSWNIIYKRDDAFYSHAGLRIGATPDAFAFRPDLPGMGVVQVKIVSEDILANEWTEDEGEIVPPEWIMVQAMVEAKMTGCEWASVYVMAVGRGIKGHMLDIPLLPGVWDRVLAENAKFWQLVDSGAEPSPDWERDAQTVAEVYRRSKPKTDDRSDDLDLDIRVEQFAEVRARRKRAQDEEEVLRAMVLHGVKESEVVLTRRFVVKASSSINEAGKLVRRISIKGRN